LDNISDVHALAPTFVPVATFGQLAASRALGDANINSSCGEQATR